MGSSRKNESGDISKFGMKEETVKHKWVFVKRMPEEKRNIPDGDHGISPRP